MAKKKTVFFCNNCGAESAKWVGKCPSCGQWNTYVEEVVVTGSKKITDTKESQSKPQLIKEISSNTEVRNSSNDDELDRVLGGGIVAGSLVLIGGEPGIGKSTLMLQIALHLPKLRILYISGEESDRQVKMRADRIKESGDQLFILTETNLEVILQHAKKMEPRMLVIDSIQTMFSDLIESTPGSISQVRHCTGELMKFAKQNNVPVFLIGHITKDGSIAGPKLLEHMVDTVIQFEGDRHLSYRILRTSKNRFGSTSELGIYEMQSNGLRQVTNPSEILITQREEQVSGVTIGAALEGNRPLLIEVQSLVTPATYGTPQRSSTGFDIKRLNMLLAVLEKRGGFRLGTHDVFLNIAGGLKVDDPAIDLAVMMSILSSFQDIEIPHKVCFAGEVGLGGEIRAVNRIESRISEAEKLGFEAIYISKFNTKGLNQKDFKISIKTMGRLHEVVSDLMA